MTTGDLRSLSRRDLVARAEELGVARAAALTKSELVEAIREAENPSEGRRSRTWFGKARDLVARVVEQGLHLPNTAKILRGQAPEPGNAPPPLPTVTLAEIYAAQGYTDKALAVIDAVLERVPDHADALALRERLGGAPSQTEPVASPSPEAAQAVPSPSAQAVASPSAQAVAQAAPSPSEPPRPEPPRPSQPPEIQDLRPSDVTPEAGSEKVPETSPPEDSADVVATAPRYDDVVALATDPRTAYVYWELRAVSFARARWRAPEGHLVLRVLSLVPTEGGAERRSRDVPIDELSGDTFVTGLVPGAEVRFAVGWIGDGAFAALAVAPELTMPRDYTAPVKSTQRATMSEAAAMRAAARSEGAPPPAPDSPLVELAGRRLADYAGGSPTSVVHFQYSTRRVRTVLRAGGASDLLADHETEVTRHRGSLGQHAWLAGGASDLLTGGASDLVGRSH